jgi:hypothetical protein
VLASRCDKTGGQDVTDAIKRREFLAAAAAAAAGAGAGLAGCSQVPLTSHTPAPATQPTDAAPPRAPGQRSMRGVPFDTRGRARIAIVGTGLRGRSVLAELLAIKGAEITAIADLRPANAALALEDIKAAKRPAPRRALPRGRCEHLADQDRTRAQHHAAGPTPD